MSDKISQLRMVYNESNKKTYVPKSNCIERYKLNIKFFKARAYSLIQLHQINYRIHKIKCYYLL